MMARSSVEKPKSVRNIPYNKANKGYPCRIKRLPRLAAAIRHNDDEVKGSPDALYAIIVSRRSTDVVYPRFAQ